MSLQVEDGVKRNTDLVVDLPSTSELNLYRPPKWNKIKESRKYKEIIHDLTEFMISQAKQDKTECTYIVPLNPAQSEKEKKYNELVFDAICTSILKDDSRTILEKDYASFMVKFSMPQSHSEDSEEDSDDTPTSLNMNNTNLTHANINMNGPMETLNMYHPHPHPHSSSFPYPYPNMNQPPFPFYPSNTVPPGSVYSFHPPNTPCFSSFHK